MGERITVVGGSESAISVTLDGAQAVTLANQFRDELSSYYQNNQLNYLDVTESPSVNDLQGLGVITAGGAYSAGNGYDYIVVGGYNYASNPTDSSTYTTANLLDAAVTINSVMTSAQTVRVLAGNTGNFVYNAAQENGQLAAGNAESAVKFVGDTVSGGNWTINTGAGNDTIIAGSGNNSIYASTGANTIDITAGTNVVDSYGQDSIIASQDSTGQNRITLRGGESADSHSTVSVNSGAFVSDLSSYNTVTVGGGSTIEGGTSGTYTFDGSYNSNVSRITGGTSDTVTATSDMQVIHGNSNTITTNKTLSFFNGSGDITASAGGQAIGFGAADLNYTLNATGSDSGLFVAGVGNETLDASGSTAATQIYANTVAGATSDFIAKGGSGNDTLAAGTGNATFTGGSGDNLFLFTKESTDNGNTVITDFANSSNNKIALHDYGLDSDSLATLLQNSKNDTNGNAVLNLTGHKITIEGVSASDLTTNQFDIYNKTTTITNS